MDEENQVATVPQTFGMSVNRDPMKILTEAKRAAVALTDIISNLPKEEKVIMGGKQYIEFDHWQMIGRFYGCSVKVTSTEHITIGAAQGFLSRADVLDGEGRVISSAEAMCMNDEEKWATRPKYEYPNGKKTKVGEVPVPLNQLRSMAQTRSCAKALRHVFSWVVVLAGYAATPVEEMTGDEHADQRPPIQQPIPKTVAPAQAQAQPKPDSQEQEELTYESIMVKDVTVEKRKKKDGNGTWDCYIILGAQGFKGEAFAEVGKPALAAKGKKAQVGYVLSKWGNKVKAFQVEPDAETPFKGTEGLEEVPF